MKIRTIAENNRLDTKGSIEESKYDGLDFHDEFSSWDDLQCYICNADCNNYCDECEAAACDQHSQLFDMHNGRMQRLCNHCSTTAQGTPL